MNAERAQNRSVLWQGGVAGIGFAITATVAVIVGVGAFFAGFSFVMPVAIVSVLGAVLTTVIMWRDDLRAARQAREEDLRNAREETGGGQ